MNLRSIKMMALIIFMASVAFTSLLAQTTPPPPQTFSTTIYFDYNFNLTNSGYITGTDAAKALNNKFNFRRAYFRYENKISDLLKFRLTYDADNTANITAVDFGKASTKKDDKLRPFIKHLYLDYSGLLPNSSLKIGMIETLTFKLAEDEWGYRSVAKTLVDGYKDVTGVDIRASSADIGANLTGAISKAIRYGFMVSNGEGYTHPELNKFKKFSGQVRVIPAAGLSLVGYYEYEKQDDMNKAVTYKVDSYFDMVKGLTLAAEYFNYDNDKFTNADLSHYDTRGLSIWGIYKIVVDKFNVFARYDHYIPNSTKSLNNINLIIAGFDWTPVHKSWRLQPNIWYYTYADSTKKGDAVFNLTFFLSF
jgi:hypothetical protein